MLKFRNAHNRTTPRRTKIITISESAYKGIPRELQKVGESALKGDTICVWRVDRLSRNIILYYWLEDLDKRRLISYPIQRDFLTADISLIFRKILQAQRICSGGESEAFKEKEREAMKELEVYHMVKI